MKDNIKDALNYIISEKKIRTVFQPIISLRDGQILGHEALSRITCESEIENPEMMFIVAEECNRVWDLELLCRTTALEAAYKFMIPPYSKKLFINVNPNVMYDYNFRKGFTKKFLEQYKILPQNVTFEITVRNVVKDIDSFKTTINHYKRQNYNIAIDDTGAGYSGLNLISEVGPNYIKLDMKLIRDIDSDRLKYAIVKGMVEFSKASNTFLIAEGIETYGELDTLVNLGVQYGQGYLVQKPCEEIKSISNEFLENLRKINNNKNNIYHNFNTNTYTYIESLCNPIDTVSPEEMVQNVFETFNNDSECFGVCVIDEDIPVGIVTKEKLGLKLSGHYGFSLYKNKKISKVMDKEFLSVEYKTPISLVSSMAMSRPNDKLYDFIVVTENYKYKGIVTIKNLLQKSTEIEISAAKHQNPLSGLPGNIIIEQKLSKCVEINEKYTVAYLDIDNFKAYNDVYGFENGDLVIKLLANVLRERITKEEFIGHVGGDDFVIIINDHLNEDYFNDLVNQFETQVRSLYSKEDLEKGYIVTANRHGEIEKFPIITLCCVSINNKIKQYKSTFELTETLAGLKIIKKSKRRN